MSETTRVTSGSSTKGKVIITCAITGAIHTPTMSPYLPITPDEIAEGSARCSRGGCRDPASPCARSGNRQAGPNAGGFRQVPAAHQAEHQCRHQHHHRRQPLHEGRRAGETGGDLQAGGRFAQYGFDQFRTLSPRSTNTRSSSSIGRSRIWRRRAIWYSATLSRTSSTSLRPATTTVRDSSSSATTSPISIISRISPIVDW